MLRDGTRPAGEVRGGGTPTGAHQAGRRGRSPGAMPRREHPGALAAAELETRACLDALRDLAAGSFPPALAEHGIGPALESADRCGSEGVVSVRRRGGRSPLPAARRGGRLLLLCGAGRRRRGGRAPRDRAGRGCVPADASWPRVPSAISPAVHQLMLDRVEALGGGLTISRGVGEVVVRGEIPTDRASASTLVERWHTPSALRWTSDPRGSAMTLRVVVAEDNPLLREGLRSLILTRRWRRRWWQPARTLTS